MSHSLAGAEALEIPPARNRITALSWFLREVKLAIVADIGSLQRLPRIIGEGHTRDLAFTGRDVTADGTLRMGLVSQVFATRDEVLSVARSKAKAIAENPALVVQGIKQIMNECAHKSIDDGLRHVAIWNAAFLQSNDFQEAMMAFVEKRAAKFVGS